VFRPPFFDTTAPAFRYKNPIHFGLSRIPKSRAFPPFRDNSLLGRNKFPVPVRREFSHKALKLLPNFEPLAGGRRPREQNSLYWTDGFRPTLASSEGCRFGAGLGCWLRFGPDPHCSALRLINVPHDRRREWPYSCASQRYRRKWDREFESGSLQRGVRCEPLAGSGGWFQGFGLAAQN
jgi:hypothetical protein